MRWLVTIEGDRRDIERLSRQSPERLAESDGPGQLILDFVDDEHDVPSDEARQAGRVTIESALRRMNGFGKLRWGRSFAGVKVKDVRYFDPDGGDCGQVVFAGTAYGHLTPEEYADMMERLGHPRPAPPEGSEDINALNLTEVSALTGANPEVGRVLRLVELMLAGDEDIDWAAGYAALEVIDQDVHRRGENGAALGWWTKKEFDRFTQMANSVEATGMRSRHQGRRFDAPKKLLTPKEAAWFVRRVTARWVSWLLSHPSDAER